MMGGTHSVELTWTAKWLKLDWAQAAIEVCVRNHPLASTTYVVANEYGDYLSFRRDRHDGAHVDDAVVIQMLTKIFIECASGRADLKAGEG